MTDILTLTEADGIATVSLNRPDRKNAWVWDTFDGLADMAAQLATRDGLRAVILRGAGGCFSSGLDTSMFMEFAGDMDAVKAQMAVGNGPRGANRFQAPCVAWQDLPVPVIAAIDGVAYGAGMQLALAADFRIAAPDARLSIREAKWGLIPDMGLTQSLPKLLRADLAKDLIMTGRVLDADVALGMGLITRIADDPHAAAQAMAAELSARSPDAVRATKTMVEAAWATPDALALEAALQADLIGSPNQVEAVMAGMQNRPPKFR
ncbi:hypothetical protein ACMU_16220 [Actibacterium mucosum KCTC 23349]|uniref:Enoyl-CoA hydratase n=1 Tax=Actibacterium mucosum KCTC 23349 TaxID=1454373 RepID=A0A037ZIJ3_9RHOB|nr:crotonase/enoyl-CoA hydratase family protein [Actibacterium mucosum]KAJ54660.1 hypothetical protein ACMU_16220 [Actibacterium mucosum KCTC 23349]